MARTFLLMAAMTALLGGIGALLAGPEGIFIALLIAVFMNGFAYWNSDKMVLSMHGARPVSRQDIPFLFDMVERLAHQANLPMPALYVIEQDQANAFATGRDPQHAAVAATTGLLRQLSREEIEAVMAHELAHVKNRDTLTMTITATLAGAVSLLANFAMFFGSNRNNAFGFAATLLIMIFAPMAAALVQMAISRSREYEADRLGALICGNPLGLANALRRLSTRQPRNMQAEQNPASAHLFIANPLRKENLAGLFSTHPPMEERVRRLEAMATRGTGGGSAIQAPETDRFDRYKSAPDRYDRPTPTGTTGVPNSGGKTTKSKPKNNPWG